MSIFRRNKKNKEKEYEEIPEYFNNIKFHEKNSLIRSACGILELLSGDLKLKGIEIPEFATLADVIRNEKINEKTKYRLFMFGIVLNGLLNRFELKENVYIDINKETNAFVVYATSHNGESITITERGFCEFVVDDLKSQDVYTINNDFTGVDKFGDSYRRYFRIIDDKDCYLAISHSDHIEKEKIGNKRYQHRATLISSKYDFEQGKIEEYNYSYLCSDDHSLGSTSISIEVNEVKKLNDDQLENLTQYVKNLKVPVETTTLLKDIGDRLAIYRNQVGLNITQIYNGILYDEISVDLGVLKSMKVHSREKDSTITILPDRWSYGLKEKDDFGKEIFSFQVEKVDNNPPAYMMTGTSFNDFMDVPSSSELYKSGKKACEKMLSKVPGWIKRN